MKALSVKQPWAELIRAGTKTVEVRTRRTSYRGPLLICSSKKMDPLYPNLPVHDGPFSIGMAECIVDLVDCVPFSRALHLAKSRATPNTLRAYLRQANDRRGDCDARLWAWILKDARPVERRAISGKLGIFEVQDVPKFE